MGIWKRIADWFCTDEATEEEDSEEIDAEVLEDEAKEGGDKPSPSL